MGTMRRRNGSHDDDMNIKNLFHLALYIRSEGPIERASSINNTFRSLLGHCTNSTNELSQLDPSLQ
jgi:hypothetical protein